jgi:hypothetical protein
MADKSSIVAVVTTNKEKVIGDALILLAESTEELEQISFKLEKILDASAHDLGDGIMILVHH